MCSEIMDSHHHCRFSELSLTGIKLNKLMADKLCPCRTRKKLKRNQSLLDKKETKKEKIKSLSDTKHTFLKIKGN